MNFYDDIDMYKKRTAVISENRNRYTYDDLINDGKTLYEDIEKRSLIFIICTNTYESIAAYIGALRKRIVPVMINSKIDKELYILLLESYAPEYVVCKCDCELCDEIADLGFVKLQTSEFSKNDFDYQILKNPKGIKSQKSEDLALLLTTSGSTGSPKLVRQTYKNIMSNSEAIAQYLEIESDDKAITTMPMSYTYCLSIIQSHFLKGAAIIANESPMVGIEGKAFWTLLKEEEATTFGGVPYIYEILKKLHFERMKLPSIRYITQAGGRLGKELSEEFSAICKSKNIQFIVMYGQTEATARISYLPWQYAIDKAGSIGIAIPGGRLEIHDVDGKVIDKPEITGELVYTGENVTPGYATSAQELNNPDERNGVLETGDMAKKDKDGFFYITGRKKRFLKMYGNRINLDEVESILKQQGYECVCSGKDDHMMIYIVSEDESIKKKIPQFLNMKLGIYIGGFKVSFIGEIPRNEAGKIMYSKLEEY